MIKMCTVFLFLALTLFSCGYEQKPLDFAPFTKDSLLTDKEVTVLGGELLRLTKMLRWWAYSLCDTGSSWSDSLVDSLGSKSYIELELEEVGCSNVISGYVDLANDSAPEYTVRYTFHKDMHPLIEGGHWVEYRYKVDSIASKELQEKRQEKYPKEIVPLEVVYNVFLHETSLDTFAFLFPNKDSPQKRFMRFWFPEQANYTEEERGEVEKNFEDDNLIIHSGHRSEGNIARSLKYQYWKIWSPYRYSSHYKEKQEGEVKVYFLIDNYGKVFHVELVSSTFDDFDFENQVVEMVRSLDFTTIASEGDMTECSYSFVYKRKEE